jgi:hypothetical protein
MNLCPTSLPVPPRKSRAYRLLRNLLCHRGRAKICGYPARRIGRRNPFGVPPMLYLVHRLVAAVCLGRLLQPIEEVHHRSGQKTDNRPTNLLVCSRKLHKFYHRLPGCLRRRPGEPQRRLRCRCGCGTVIARYDSQGRPRLFVYGHHLRRGCRGRRFWAVSPWRRARGCRPRETCVS